MFSFRATTRASQALRNTASQTVAKRSAPRRNFATEKDVSAGGLGHGVTGGLIGGGVVLAAGYGYYHFSGAKSVVNATSQAKSYADQAAEQVKTQLREITPDRSEDVLGAIKEVAHQYARWIPGGKQFVDTSFKDLEDIKSKHEDEVNRISRATYNELREVANRKGTSIEALNDAWQILSERLQELSSLIGDVSQQILDNHPDLREKLGGSFDQLKQLGDRLGPEAKKQVDETFKEASQIARQGISTDSASRLQKLVQDKLQELKKLGDKSWESGYEQIKPLLEKNPQVKKFFEQNIDTLKSGHVTDVVEKVRNAVQSGSTSGLENYVQE